MCKPNVMNAFEKDVVATLSHPVYNPDENGRYPGARFHALGDIYTMNKIGWLFDADHHRIYPSWSKNGIYPEYVFRKYGKEYRVKAYVLSMICLVDGAAAIYFGSCVGGKIVINHMLCERDDFGRLVPVKDYAYDPKYLELCTVSENNRHAKVVAGFGLDNLVVSVKDVDELRDLLNEEWLKALADGRKSECYEVAKKFLAS